MHIERIHKMIEDLTEYGKEMVECGTGSGKVDIDCATKIVDMIKDLTEAAYHASIVKAMEEAKEDEEAEEKYMLQRMKEEYGEGEEAERYYNEWRYADGRYAPKGRGSRRGYRERRCMMPDEYMYEPEYYRDMDRRSGRMYYTNPGTLQNMAMDSSKSYTDGYSEGNSDGYKRGYDEGSRNGSMRRDAREGRSGQSRRSYMDSKSNAMDKDTKMRELEKYANELNTDITEMMSGASPEEKSMMKNKLTALASKV